MSTGLRDLLGLPDPAAAADGDSSDVADAFRQKFRDALKRVNESQRTNAAYAPVEEHEGIDSQRAKLESAYQQTLKRLGAEDGKKASQDAERVLTAAESLGSKASASAKDAEAKHKEWADQEAEFDAAIDKVAELEDAKHPKAPVLRDLLDAVSERLARRAYGDAIEAFTKISPKVDAIHEEAAKGAIAGAASAGKRTVPGGGGYMYEQHADGTIFIVKSPRSGDKRTKLKDGGKAYNAVLAEIGPFPISGEATSEPTGTGDASPILDAIFAAGGAAVDAAGELIDDITDAVSEAVDDVAAFFGAGGDEPPADGSQQPAAAEAAPVQGPTPEIMGGAETEVEKKLAEFTLAMKNIDVEVDGETVSVRPPYHWNRKVPVYEKVLDPETGEPVKDEETGKFKWQKALDDEGEVKKKPHKILQDALDARKDNPKVAKLLKRIFGGDNKDFGRGATIGKATPEQMKKFLEESLKEGLIKDKSALGMKEYLDTYGVSTDCSGLVTQALNFLNDGDLVRGPEEMIDSNNVGTGEITNERKKYAKVKKPSDLRAGDVMAKVGHVRMITDVDIEDDGVYFTTLESTTAKISDVEGVDMGVGVGERRWRFKDPNKFSKIESNKSGKFKRSSGDDVYLYTRHTSLQDDDAD